MANFSQFKPSRWLQLPSRYSPHENLNVHCAVKTKDDHVVTVTTSVPWWYYKPMPKPKPKPKPKPFEVLFPLKEQPKPFVVFFPLEEQPRTDNFKKNVRACVTNELKARVRKLHLNDFFMQQDQIAKALKEELVKVISNEKALYGFQISGTVTLDISQDNSPTCPECSSRTTMYLHNTHYSCKGCHKSYCIQPQVDFQDLRTILLNKEEIIQERIPETSDQAAVSPTSRMNDDSRKLASSAQPPPWDQHRQPLGPSHSVSPPSTSGSNSKSGLSRWVSTGPSSSGSKSPDGFNLKLKCPADTPNLKNAVMLYQPVDGDTPTRKWVRWDTSYEFVKNLGGGDERFWVLKVGSKIEARVLSDMPWELFKDTHRIGIGDCVLEFSDDEGYQNFVTVFQDCLSKNTDGLTALDENNKDKEYGKEGVDDSKDVVQKSLEDMPSGIISVKSAIAGLRMLLCGAKARIITPRKKVLLPVTRRDCIATDDPSLQTRRSTDDWVELAKTLLTLSASACYASSSSFPRVANGVACIASMNAISLGHRSETVTRILIKFGAMSCAAGILYEMGKDLPEEYILVPIIVFLIIATIVALAE